MSEPVPIGDAIKRVAKQLGFPAADVAVTVAARWSEIVGPAIAQHAEVRSVRDGECTIAVDGPAWATQLRYGASDLVARVNEHCGEGAVTSIKVVVSGPRNSPRKTR